MLDFIVLICTHIVSSFLSSYMATSQSPCVFNEATKFQVHLKTLAGTLKHVTVLLCVAERRDIRLGP